MLNMKDKREMDGWGLTRVFLLGVLFGAIIVFSLYALLLIK